MTVRFVPVFLLLILFFVACTPAAEEPTAAPTAEEIPTEENLEEDTSEEMSDEDMTEEAEEMEDAEMDEEAEMEATEEAAAPAEAEAVNVAYNGPEWTSLPLVNARTGETFTLADFAGKTVFVEPMATWCSNCRAQQGSVAQAMSGLSTDEFVFISLSVEGSAVTDGDLASYAERNSFPQIFVVATPELLNALVDQFGRGVTNPPSTPHFILSPSGNVSGLSTGRLSPDAITVQVTDAANSG
jgi:cytochrome oxidase Cu insertion factor (SCO1/SenC/PrrC family)